MMIQTSFSEFTTLAKSQCPIAICATLSADELTPMNVFSKLYQHFGNGLLSEIAEFNRTIMGFNPRGQFEVKQGACLANLDGKIYPLNADVLTALREFKALAKVACSSPSPSLSGGMAGLVSYDAIRLFEKKLAIRDVSDVPEVLFYCYQINVTYIANESLAFSVVVPNDHHLTQRYQQGIHLLEKLEAIIHAPSQIKHPKKSAIQNELIEVDVSDDTYQSMVLKAKHFIQEGDVFQVVLSRKFKKNYHADPLQIYRDLRRETKAAYLFYFDDGQHLLLGASPEKLLSVDSGLVETIPIAGTCSAFDSEAVKQLVCNEKELAEHCMLVDLARNDLAKICVPGSVKVFDTLKPKKAGSLVHLTSIVRGQLSPECDEFSAFKAVFPAGTVSGAPKLRAMQIIDQLETTSRGFYGGAFCLLDGLGRFDSAIMLRTTVLHDGMATVTAGAGIVFDSIPKREADESRAKAMSVLKAMKGDTTCY